VRLSKKKKEVNFSSQISVKNELAAAQQGLFVFLNFEADWIHASALRDMNF